MPAGQQIGIKPAHLRGIVQGGEKRGQLFIIDLRPKTDHMGAALVHHQIKTRIGGNGGVIGQHLGQQVGQTVVRLPGHRPVAQFRGRQIEGGSAQGLGYALIEKVVMHDGAMANASLTNYTIPTTLDTPDMDVAILENPYAGGPWGAKGLGELPIDGPAPAVVNAIRHLGIDVREIPATPEIVMAACDSR